MEERDNKTIICSVLFLDIVEYSQKAVSGQISLKEGFNVFLSTALDDIPVRDRIILDTGDGAAISFLGDIEDALKVGLSMRESLLTAGVHMDPPLLVRMGINLGPVRLVKDINNQPNIVGDGINVAQRVMGFADIGQLLVSRSYYDAVSRISQEYAGMFHYQGSRTDKHVREHEVYAIGYPGEFSLTKKNSEIIVKVKKAAAELMHGVGKWAGGIYGAYQNASNRQRILYLAAPVLSLLLVAAVLPVVKRGSIAPVKQVVVRYYPDAAQATSSVAGFAVKKSEAVKVMNETAKVNSAKKMDKPSIARVRTLEETTGAAAVMSLVVLPWGEVYLDGRMQGVSPPLIELQVAPGKHEIEIRNSNFPVYKQTIQPKVGEKLNIKHTFAN
ncbi:MAG TPA: adenylate/guanylate cyclase domain-containing protein [Gallionellaceae bacterium]|nr:adenylate/guanylate cyclase domain-containing protein [Gallionellaceae bacterium]